MTKMPTAPPPGAVKPDPPPAPPPKKSDESPRDPIATGVTAEDFAAKAPSREEPEAPNEVRAARARENARRAGVLEDTAPAQLKAREAKEAAFDRILRRLRFANPFESARLAKELADAAVDRAESVVAAHVECVVHNLTKMGWTKEGATLLIRNRHRCSLRSVTEVCDEAMRDAAAGRIKPPASVVPSEECRPERGCGVPADPQPETEPTREAPGQAAATVSEALEVCARLRFGAPFIPDPRLVWRLCELVRKLSEEIKS